MRKSSLGQLQRMIDLQTILGLLNLYTLFPEGMEINRFNSFFIAFPN